MDTSLTGLAARMADFQPALTSLAARTDASGVIGDPKTHQYYVGDLCYVLNSDQWEVVCLHDFEPDLDGEYDPEGFLDPEAFDWTNWDAAKPFIIFNTAYGDGVYNDKEGNPYCVDSGTLGCIRTDFADPEKLADALERGLGHLHTFDEEFTSCSCGDDNGVIYFGDVEIDTAGDMDFDDDDEDADEAYDND